MPYIEHPATIDLFGETIEVPLWIQYEHHDRIGEAREPGGLAISPAEPEHCEIQEIFVIERHGKVTKSGYVHPKMVPLGWLLYIMTDDQRGEIEQAILEELE